MNFRQMMQAEKTVSNNPQICALQSKFEAQAWIDHTTVLKLKLAVMWLRENPDRTAQEAEKKFFQ